MARTLSEQLYKLAQEAPEREALRVLYAEQDDVVLSRAELVIAAQHAAQKLAALGVGEADLVIIVQGDSLLLAASFFGAALLKATPSILPFSTEKLHPERYRSAMAALIELSAPTVLMTEPEYEAQIRDLLPDANAGMTLPEVLALKPEDMLAAGEVTPPAVNYDPDQVALLQHSSGTTGLQKGVALAHRAIFDQLEYYGDALDFSEDDVIVSWLPLYHDMGLIAGFLMPLTLGAKLVLLSPFDWVRAPYTLLHAITAHQGTLCWLPNFSYNFLAQKIRDNNLEGVDLSSIRAFVNCSEPIYANSHNIFTERFAPYGVEPTMLQTSYAMAETVFAVSQSKPGQAVQVDTVDRDVLRLEGVARPVAADAESAQAVVSSGQPLTGMDVQVLDDNKQELKEREIGEIVVRCSYMLTEYHQRPDATEAAFHNGWYLTGDMGYVADGEVYVLGRKKDVIIVGGRNIYPRDLEVIISEVEGVHPGRVVTFGVPDQRKGTEDVAVIAEVDVDDEDEKRRIATDIRRIVAGGSEITMRYVELVPRGWLVKTSSGKVSRSSNRMKFLEMRGM